MPSSSSQFFRQLLEIWNRLSPKQRLSLVIFSVAVFASLATMTYFMNRVEYEVLYRDLNPEDAQAIAVKLKDLKKDYIVQDTSILVAGSKTEVDKLRLEIAGSGLARSGRVGYEIFDKNQFGMTDFTEQVNLQRALEGELARTISALSEISEARVHLVLPKDSPFEEKKEAAKASVAVRLRKDNVLTKAHIAGIRGLVAGAVRDLRPSNVSVIDDEGKLLSGAPGSAFGDLDDFESGVREQLEKEMVIKVISILEPIVGKGKVHANASLELDTNTTEQTEETFNPNPPAVISQQKTEERLGSAATASGVPGSIPATPPAGTTSGPERSRQSEVTNYEVNKMVRHTLQPKGTVRRISVAVILDHKLVQKQGSDGKPIAGSQPYTQQELDAYRELVNAAIGFDKERGDTVTLENMPFYREIQFPEEKPNAPWYLRWTPGDSNRTTGWQALAFPAIKYLAFLILFLLAYLMLFRPISKRVLQTMDALSPAPAQEPERQIAGVAAGRALTGTAPENGTEGIPAIPGAAADMDHRQNENADLAAVDDQIEQEFMQEAKMFDLGTRKFAALKRRLTEKAQREPEVITQVLRSWIHER